MPERFQPSCSAILFLDPTSLTRDMWELRMSASWVTGEDAGGISRNFRSRGSWRMDRTRVC